MRLFPIELFPPCDIGLIAGRSVILRFLFHHFPGKRSFFGKRGSVLKGFINLADMLNGTDDRIGIHNEMMPEEEQFAAVVFASYQTGAVELDIHAVVGE